MAGLDKYIEEYNKSKGGTGTSSSQDEEKNKGGFWGGAEYLGTKFVDGFVSNIEGMVDFAVGGVAGLIGLGGNENAKEFAEDVFRDDWYNYERADEKYNPGKGMNVLGDIAGVVGGAVPDVAIGLLTGGLGWGAKVISAGTSLASSAGRGLNEAVNTTGDLGAKEWAGGIGSGVLSAGVELISGGLGDLAGGAFGKTGVEMGGELAESLGKKASNETIESIFKKTVGKEAAGEFGESAVGKLVNSIWNSKTFRELAGEMTSEGLEESFETILEPFIKQNTYQPDAPNATLGDIAYSGFLGAVAGGVMSGSVNTLNNAITTKRGATIANNNNKLTSLFGNAEAIINYENKNDTGSQIFGAVSNMYQDIQNKLQQSGGRMTASIYNDIGKLDALVASAVMQPSVVNAAKGVAQNAESMAEQLNSFYKKTGQNKTVTAEQLTKGLKLDGSSKDFVKSVTDALNANATLREVVINNMLGRLDFDAKVYANSIYGDTDIRSIATQQNINRFLGSADAATLGQTGEVLGISDWASLTPQELAEKIQQFRRNGGEEAFAEGISSIKEAQKAKGYTNGMPGDISALKQGATRFKVGEADFAIIRHGDSYRLYDYNTGHITKSVQMGDMNSLVARLRERAAQVGRESGMQALDREIDNFAMENVPEYKSLTAAEKEAVRATLRYAQASGISMKDQILFARIAAKSGMNIITVKGLLDNKAAWYDGMNTVYIDSTSPRTRVFSGILGHELYHKMFKSDKRRKLFDSALQNIDQTLKDETKAEYKAELQKLNRYTEQEIEAISDEEAAAAYAEKLFNTPGVWSYILDGEPNLSERVINFFKGSPKRYNFAPEMDPAAKAWIREYKKLFDEVARFNAGENVASNVQKIKRIGKIVDEDAVDGRYDLDENLGEQLNEWIANNGNKGKKYNGVYFRLGTTPDVFIKHGAQKSEMIMYDEVVAKVTGMKGDNAHSISLDEISKLPSQLNDPILLFKGSVPDSFVAITELVDKQGHDVVVAVHINKKHGRSTITKIASLYSKTNEYGTNKIVSYVNNQIKNGNLLDASAKKAPMWFTTRGLQLPKVVQTIINANKSISQNSQNSKAFDKNSAKNFKTEGRSALADGKRTSENLTEAEREMLNNPWVERAERETIVDALLKEAKTNEDRDTLHSYIRDLDLLEEKLMERADLLKAFEAVKNSINDMYKAVENKADRKKVTQSNEYKDAKQKAIVLEGKIALVEDEISRRDTELFRTSSAKPLHDLVMRAYKIGKDEGASAKISQGLINKRIAAIVNSKFFTLKEAKGIIEKIASQYPVEDFNVKSELARKLWTQLNATEDIASQKTALKGIANDIVNAVYAKKSNDLKIEKLVVKRAEKYKKKIAFTPEERAMIKKYYGETADNVLSIWEYDGDRNVQHKSVNDFLWDLGQIKKYEKYLALKDSQPSFRADAFIEAVDVYEDADEKIAPLKDESQKVRNNILDTLIREFVDGGRETYKAKYTDLSNTVKIRNKIEQHAKDFKNLVKGTFANSTSYKSELFTHTLDEIPNIMYRGTLYDGRARKVAKALNEWYNPENAMLMVEGKLDPNLYREDIAEMLSDLSSPDENTRLSKEDLVMLDDVIRYFYHFVETYNKIFRNGKWVDALPVAEQYMKKAQDHANRNVRGYEKLFANKYVKSFGDAESVMKIADGYQNGIFYDTYNSIREGYIEAKVLEMHITEDFDSFLEHNKKYIDKLNKEEVTYRDQKVPKLDLIGYYMSLSRHHLIAGAAFSGHVYDRLDGSGKGIIKGFLSDVDPKTVDRSELIKSAEIEQSKIEKLFSENDLKFISIIEQMYEECGEIKHEADMNLYGYSNIDKTGGKYYPGSRYAAGMKNASLDVFSGMSGTDRFTHASFNKRIVKGAKQALYIENPITLAKRHVREVCMYAKVSPTVENFDRLWRLDVASNANLPMSLQTFFDLNKNVWRADDKIVGFEYLKEMMSDIMGVGNKKGSKLLSTLRRNYATFALGGVVGANPKVVVTQFSSLISATSIIKPISLVKGAAINGSDVDKYCPLAELRNKDESVVKAEGVIDKIGKIGEKTTFLISKTDRLVIKRLFAACQAEVASNDLPIGSERNKTEAGKLLHDIILKTQNNSLVTERTESMRSGSEFLKMLSMFRGDSIKNTARFIDAVGEVLYIRNQISDVGETDIELKEKLSRAYKKLEKSSVSLLLNSFALVVVAKGFEWLYAKEDEDERKWLDWLVAFGGNLLGGLPIISQVYSKLIEGYSFEGFEYSMINDLLDSVEIFGSTFNKILEGKATSDDLVYSFMKSIDAIGQMLGIPTRNIKNTIFGLIKRFDPSTYYRIDDAFSKQNYASDLKDAIAKGDDRLVVTIIELAFGDKMGSGLSDEAIKELMRLAKLGESVVPGAIGDTVTVDGVEREITGKELKAIREKYGEAIDQINKFLKTDLYKSFDDEQKADAVRKIYNLYKNLAYDEVLGTEKDRDMHILSKVLEMDSLVALEAVSIFSSDKDEEGETIDGSRREKILAAILNLDISDEDKLLMISASGYTLNNGDIPGMSGYAASEMLYNYISELDGISEEERLRIYDICGFKVKNEGAIPDTPTNGDFEYELDQGDVENATDIFNKVVLDKLGQSFKESTSGEIIRLAQIGDKFADKVMPSAISDKVTINGEERELTKEEYAVIKEKYGESVQRIDTFLESDLYKSYTDEQKASAIAKIYDLYKNLAYDSTLGTEKDKEALILYGAVDPDVLCAWETMSVLESDKDADGNTIAGSKRKKIVEAINNLDASDEEKLLLIAMKGYSLKDGDVSGLTAYQADVKLYNYILSLDLSEEERIVLFKAAGFDVKNGEVQKPSASGSSSSGSSSSKRTSSGSKSSSGGSLTNPSGPLSRVTRNRVRRIGKIV